MSEMSECRFRRRDVDGEAGWWEVGGADRGTSSLESSGEAPLVSGGDGLPMASTSGEARASSINS